MGITSLIFKNCAKTNCILDFVKIRNTDLAKYRYSEMISLAPWTSLKLDSTVTLNGVCPSCSSELYGID